MNPALAQWLAIFVALAVAGIAAWPQLKRAASSHKTDQRRLELDEFTQLYGSVRAAMTELEAELRQLHKQTHAVLAENNFFRIAHGIIPVTALDTFQPISPIERDRVLRQVTKIFSTGYRTDPDMSPGMSDLIDELDSPHKGAAGDGCE